MKKYAGLLWSAVLVSALFAHTGNASTLSEKQIDIVDQRMSNMSMDEVIKTVLATQLECNKRFELDVCEGVKALVKVLERRVDLIPEESNEKMLAFIDGLISGVNQANQKSIENIQQLD